MQIDLRPERFFEAPFGGIAVARISPLPSHFLPFPSHAQSPKQPRQQRPFIQPAPRFARQDRRMLPQRATQDRRRQVAPEDALLVARLAFDELPADRAVGRADMMQDARGGLRSEE